MSQEVSRKGSNLVVGGESWEPLTGFKLFWAHLAALTKKNLRIRRRAWKTNLLLVAQAALFVLLTWMVDKAVSASQQRRPAFSSVPTATPLGVGSVPLCTGNMFMRMDEPCYTLLYAPRGVPLVDSIMANVAAGNSPPIPTNQIRGFTNQSLVDKYLLDHPNTVIAAVEFIVDSPTNTVGFAVQTNSSVQWFKGRFQDPNLYAQLPVQVAVERETFRMLSQREATTWNVSVVPFPHPSAKSPSAIANFAPTFLFASLMFQFVLQLHDLVSEKESGSLRIMHVHGLHKSAHWLSWILFQSSLAIVEACLLVGFSYAFRFNLFTRNDFRLNFLLLIETALAMTSFGFMVAAFLRKASAAVPIGFFLFVVAWVFLVVLRFGFPYNPKYSDVARIFFSAFPWTLLGKGIDDLAEAAGALRGGLAWADMTSYCQIVGYLLLAVYIDNIMPDENGTKRPFWYLLQPSYWFPSKRPNLKRPKGALSILNGTEGQLDIDVKAEQDEMKVRCEGYIQRNGASLKDDSKFAIEMFGLRKTYKRGTFFRKSKVFIAVAGNCYGIRQGECFCLLGPNGAGKTTTIHCLTGVLPFSEGDALVYGTSIATPHGLSQIRPSMGVCPQFDTGLWELLSGREHLNLFGAIKGIPASARMTESSRLLEDVKLTEAADITAGAYSGGMKRRLSVAIALLGNPKIVYLDEPTTGLDPISRRHLWDLVDRVKQSRAIVLTTHSMEEADILGDRIGIMVRGRLQCVGTSLRLKSRFGSGYRVSMRVQGPQESDSSVQKGKGAPSLDGHKTRIKALFMNRLGVKSVDETHDYVHFLVPYENEDKLPLMLAYVKSHAAELGVGDVQLRLTPLEEVFLNVTRKAELQHAEAEGRFETLHLVEENVIIKVPVGAEFIQSPGGQFYHVKWVQDDSGSLKLKDYSKDPLNSKLPNTTKP